MDKILKKLDKKYLKVCVYAAVTVLITTGLALLLISSGSFWTKLWAIFTAVLKPIVRLSDLRHNRHGSQPFPAGLTRQHLHPSILNTDIRQPGTHILFI